MSDRPRILIADRSKNWSSLFETLLSADYDITITTNRQDALRRIKNSPPFHVALIDIRMIGEGITSGKPTLLDEIRFCSTTTKLILLTFPDNVSDDTVRAISQNYDIPFRCRIHKTANLDHKRFKRIVDLCVQEIVPEGDTLVEHYVDFDLHIAPDGHVTANSVQGQAIADISTDIPSNIRLSLKLIERRATDADLLKTVGLELYKWLFPGPIHTHFHQTEAVARAEEIKMRLRLRIEAEEIASLPLEFMYRETGGYFLAINPSTVLSRYLNMPLPPERVRRRNTPLHMLAIVADPTDQTRLPPDEWEAIVKQALAVPLDSGKMTLQTVKRATRKEIRNALLKQKPDIIQFVGHGIYQDGKGYLALVDEVTNKTWLVDDERFANLYMGYDDHLGLISLATCESAKSDDPQGFIGIAPKLVQRGVPAVLSMQYRVLIKTAQIFLEDFYTSVATCKPIDWATQEARNAVSLELGLDNREFATPVLYMRAEDGVIFR